MRLALAPNQHMHSHQRMFWTRCCTTCHTPSQLFQAFYGNITTSETHETSPGVGEISAGTCDVARIGTQPTHAQPPAHVLNALLHHLPHPITAVSSILQQHKHIRNTGNQSWIGVNFLQGLMMNYITLHVPLKRRVGTPIRSQREAHRGERHHKRSHCHQKNQKNKQKNSSAASIA
jgi:hypothetical protein